METIQLLSQNEVDKILNSPPPDSALLQQFKIDNNTARSIAIAVASKLPKVGGVLSFLMGQFWPTDEVSIWDQIKEQVEAMIDQKIAANNLAKLSKDLKGVQINLKNYQKLIDKSQKQSALQSINTTIEAMIPSFLSGDISSGFSCFWGIGLLHLGVRKELWELYQDEPNKTLLRESAVLYCKFGRVALANIYNGQMNKVLIDAKSDNEPGKISNWHIDVRVIDNNGAQVYSYHKYFRTNQWNEDVLNKCTIECNNDIAPKWATIETRTQKDLADWAYDAILELEKEYTYTEKAGLDQIKDAMQSTDYTAFLKNYYPAYNRYSNPDTTEKKKTVQNPHVELNPFKK
jgi:hypothetical protein